MATCREQSTAKSDGPSLPRLAANTTRASWLVVTPSPRTLAVMGLRGQEQTVAFSQQPAGAEGLVQQPAEN